MASKKWIWIGAAALAAWIFIKYLLPIAIPFLIGGMIAFAAEPGVSLLQHRLKWKRVPAVGLCVSLTLLLFAGLTCLLTAIILKELGSVSQYAPAVGRTVEQGMVVLEDFMVGLADKAPENIRPVLIQTVLNTFRDGSAVVDQVVDRVPGMVTAFVGWISRGALTVGTGILAGFLISARLPRIKAWAKRHLPENWNILPQIKRAKGAFSGWFRAQIKLMLVTWAEVTFGFLLLKIPYAPLWAGAVALVDAVPVLGTGTVLVPWSLILFLQGNAARGGGMLLLFIITWLTRSVLEPRLVGKSLGLDPLLSLMAFYAGFRLWGIPGMILTPVAAAVLKNILSGRDDEMFTNNL